MRTQSVATAELNNVCFRGMADNSGYARQADEKANGPDGGDGSGAVFYAAVVDYTAKTIKFQASRGMSDEDLTQLRKIVTSHIIPRLCDSGKKPEGQCQVYDSLGVMIYHSLYDFDGKFGGCTLIHMTSPEYKAHCSVQFQQRVVKELADQENAEKYLEKMIDEFTRNPPASSKQMQDVTDKLEATKNVIAQNIQQEIMRHGQIKITADGAADLAKGANRFAENAKNVKEKYCWQNAKCYIFIAVTVLVMLGVLIAIICVSAKC